MTIGVLAVQGAFEEHIKMLESLGVTTLELRSKDDALKDYDGLILPGGESTVQGKLIRELDMFDILKEKIQRGLPVLATCAGLILLSDNLVNDDRLHLATMPVAVKRNAYGRQLGSFHCEAEFGELGTVPMEFIRAPYIESVGDGVKVLATVNGNIVGAMYNNQIGISFHPELTLDTRIHKMFLDLTR